jgi:hypothetical protein
MHRGVMTAIEPFVEERGVRDAEITRADAHHSLGTRDALDVLPQLG